MAKVPKITELVARDTSPPARTLWPTPPPLNPRRKNRVTQLCVVYMTVNYIGTFKCNVSLESPKAAKLIY